MGPLPYSYHAGNGAEKGVLKLTPFTLRILPKENVIIYISCSPMFLVKHRCNCLPREQSETASLQVTGENTSPTSESADPKCVSNSLWTE